jgi:hypothetical protein
MWRRTCACLTLVVLETGCGSYVRPSGAAYSAVIQPPRPFVRRSPAEVDVVIGRSLLRPYIDVGFFRVYRGLGRSTEDLLAYLSVHAALGGCDAVQVLDLGPVEVGKYRRHLFSGSCTLYTDEAGQRATHTPPPPLPREGQPCLTGVGPARAGDCPTPLYCRETRCVSPYQ